MKPTVVISLDLELAWGTFDVAYGEQSLARARWTHDSGVPILLDIFSRHGLSATWAMVGMAMLDRLQPIDDLEEVSSATHPKPWFVYVPRDADESAAPEWFGRTLLERIRATRPDQEIGFHSLSHVVFGDPGTGRRRAQQEFDGCREIARRLGFRGTSFIFPRNRVHYLDELCAAGFRCYRSADVPALSLPVPRGRSLGEVAADFLAWAPRVVQPRMSHGMVEIPGSLMLRFAGGWRRHIPDSFRLERMRKGLRRVEREGGIFHVWFHPENLYDERPRLERVVERFAGELAALVRQGRVRCCTMGQVADEVMQSMGPATGEPGPSLRQGLTS